jgi:hypothetical protein
MNVMTEETKKKLKVVVDELCADISKQNNIILETLQAKDGSIAIKFMPRKDFRFLQIYIDTFNAEKDSLNEKFIQDFVDHIRISRGNDLGNLFKPNHKYFFEKEYCEKFIKSVSLFISLWKNSEIIQSQLKFWNELTPTSEERDRIKNPAYRQIAKKLIYYPGKYPLDFDKYDVVHVDGNKHNNDIRNLKLVAKK